MSILRYIERIKRENEGPRITAQEPRNMVDGGRIGFMKGKLVKHGPNTGKWVVRDLYSRGDKRGSTLYFNGFIRPTFLQDRRWITKHGHRLH